MATAENTIENTTEVSSVMLFNRDTVKFVDRNVASTSGDNKHDWAKGLDVKITDSYIKNGADNFFPNHLIDAVKRSTIQKRAFKTITSVAAGDITFINPDKSPVKQARLEQLKATYKELGLTRKKFLKPDTCSCYLFGG